MSDPTHVPQGHIALVVHVFWVVEHIDAGAVMHLCDDSALNAGAAQTEVAPLKRDSASDEHSCVHTSNGVFFAAVRLDMTPSSYMFIRGQQQNSCLTLFLEEQPPVRRTLHIGLFAANIVPIIRDQIGIGCVRALNAT